MEADAATIPILQSDLIPKHRGLRTSPLCGSHASKRAPVPSGYEPRPGSGSQTSRSGPGKAAGASEHSAMSRQLSKIMENLDLC